MNKTILYWVPVYIICSIIFYFSSIPFTQGLFLLESSDMPKHFFVYALLSFFTFIAISNTQQLKKYPGIYTVAFVFLFAISDEVHQSFVIGRFAEIKDVAVDLFSSLFLVSIKKIIV